MVPPAVIWTFPLLQNPFFPPFLSTVSREAMSNRHLFPPGSFPLTTSAKCLFSGECLVRELNITVSTDSAGYCNEINSDVCLSTVLWLRGTKAVVDVIILSIADYRRRGGRRESGWRLYKWHRLNNLLGRGGFYNSADNRDRLQPVMETPPINEKEQRKVRWKQISIWWQLWHQVKETQRGFTDKAHDLCSC